MSIDAVTDADLVRPHWWSRFPAATEAHYRAWNLEKMVPVVRGISIPATVQWLTLPFLTAWWLGEDMRATIWIGELAVLLPITTLWAVMTHPRLRRALVGYTLALMPFNGVTLMYLCWVPFTDRIGPAGAITALTAATWFSFLPMIVRLGWRSSLLIGSVFNGVAAAMLLLDYADEQLTRSEVWVPLVFVAGSTVILGVASIAAELSHRRSYVQEQIIERQRRQLTESRRLIRRYVPPTVVEQIEAGNGLDVDTPVRRRVTILFSDVVGFTDLADRLDPESLTQFINEYLAMVSQVIEDHGGTLNEFAGDGFMAIFGAPAHAEPEDQVRSALAAAEQIHTRLPGMNERWFRLGIGRPIRTRIGINTGVLSVGTFGSEGRATYTAIGLQTNIAARIQAQCEPGTTLLSDTSWHLVKDQVPCEARGEVLVKGVHFPIGLYEPRPESGELTAQAVESV